VTPFKRGQIDEAALQRLIKLQIQAGVDGIVPVGTTGESPTVDYEEHIRLIELSVKFAGGKSQSHRRHGRQLDQGSHLPHAGGRKGWRGRLASGRAVLQQADAGGSVPTFPRHRARDETAHDPLQHPGPLRRRDWSGHKPPARTRVQEHNRHERGGRNPDRVSQLWAALGPKFTILSGDDSLTLPFMAVGAQGVISVPPTSSRGSDPHGRSV